MRKKSAVKLFVSLVLMLISLVVFLFSFSTTYVDTLLLKYVACIFYLLCLFYYLTLDPARMFTYIFTKHSGCAAIRLEMPVNLLKNRTINVKTYEDMLRIARKTNTPLLFYDFSDTLTFFYVTRANTVYVFKSNKKEYIKRLKEKA